MNYAPILVLQMQRMGDMVLSFPTFIRLQKAYPLHPIWVVGESFFVEPLRSLSPQVTYFTYDNLPDFRKTSFFCVLNLSHRKEAAALAASVKTDQLFGQYMESDGSLHIKGNWQLYRASLTQNNRYNLFHWADLNSLDVVEKEIMQATNFGTAKPLQTTTQRIGLFLGASTIKKHPDALFWAELAQELHTQGYEAILLGGVAEVELANAVVATAKVPLKNKSGCFDVHGFAEYVAGLDILITPDTGPMHIAVLMGTPVLNLSMGPVNPWETGPYGKGHHVLRAHLDCVSCWECNCGRVQNTHEQSLGAKTLCKQQFLASQVNKVVSFLLTSCSQGQTAKNTLEDTLHNLEFFASTKDSHGLYSLAPACSQKILQKQHIQKLGIQKIYKHKSGRVKEREAIFAADNEVVFCKQLYEPNEYAARMFLSRFWQSWFAHDFGHVDATEVEQCVHNLREQTPVLFAEFTDAVRTTLQSVMQYARSSTGFYTDFSDNWSKESHYLHPLTGFLQMYIANTQMNSQTSLQTGQQIYQYVAQSFEENPPKKLARKSTLITTKNSRIYVLEQLERLWSFLQK